MGGVGLGACVSAFATLRTLGAWGHTHTLGARASGTYPGAPTSLRTRHRRSAGRKCPHGRQHTARHGSPPPTVPSCGAGTAASRARGGGEHIGHVDQGPERKHGPTRPWPGRGSAGRVASAHAPQARRSTARWRCRGSSTGGQTAQSAHAHMRKDLRQDPYPRHSPKRWTVIAPCPHPCHG